MHSEVVLASHVVNYMNDSERVSFKMAQYRERREFVKRNYPQFLHLWREKKVERQRTEAEEQLMRDQISHAMERLGYFPSKKRPK